MREGLFNEAGLKIDGSYGLFCCGLWWRGVFGRGYVLLRLSTIRRAINPDVIFS